MEGGPAAAFALGPVLLLLSRDGALFSGLGQGQRYAPVQAFAALYLAAGGCAALYAELAHGSHGLHSGHPHRLPYLLRNGLALAAAVPSQVGFFRYLAGGGRRDEMMLLVLAPLNLPAALLTDFGHVRWLAALGFAASVVEYSAAQSVRAAGARVL